MSEDHPMPVERPTPAPTPEAVKPALSPKDVKQDFRLSFQFSQGNIDNDTLQGSIIKGVFGTYPRDEFRAIYPEVTSEQFKTDLLGMPAHKAPKSDETREQTFLRYYEKDFIPAAQSLNNGPMDITDELLDEILMGMVKADERYQLKPRPSAQANPEADPHESFIKTYILEGKKTGSDRYDKLFEELRDRVPNVGADIGVRMDRMEIQWARNHPGQNFFPVASEKAA